MAKHVSTEGAMMPNKVNGKCGACVRCNLHEGLKCCLKIYENSSALGAMFFYVALV